MKNKSNFLSPNRDIIVIGASAGGLEALFNLVACLPADLPASIFIVHHLPPYSKSNLSSIINKKSNLEAIEAKDGMKFEKGKIYCPRADFHLMLEKDRILLSKGPKENRFRPSIDALFRSAAYEYRQRVIGVVLSGSLNDGTSGMCTIKRFGGLALIQSPKEALFDSMPTEVSRYTEVDYSLPAAELGTKLGELTQPSVNITVELTPNPDKQLEMEVNIAKNKNALQIGVLKKGEFTPFTCPDCHGALVRFNEGNLIRFRCHTGHSFTTDALLAGVTENIEKDLWQVMRGMEEGNLVLNSLAELLKEMGAEKESEKFEDKAKILLRKSRMMHKIVGRSDILSTEDIIKEDFTL